MPYGATSKKIPKVSVTFTSIANGATTTKSAGLWENTFSQHAVAQYSRYGTNATGKKGNVIKRPPGTFERVAVSVPKGPRLPYKVWSKRLKKYVWARQPIWVYKLKRVRSKVPALTGLDLPPNRLSFSYHRVSYFGGDGRGNAKITAVNRADMTNERSHEGALWTDFLLNGSSTTIGTNPQNYITDSVSSRFDAAITRLQPKALAKLYSDVKNQKVNFAQALAERAQTTGMILDLCSRLVRSVMKAKHGNLAGAASVLFPKSSKELANDFLIYQFGIKPLISDIKGCIELVANEPQLTFDVIARRTEKLPREVILDSTNLNGRCHTTITSEGQATVLYKCRVRVSDPFGQFLSDTGFSDLSLLAWELTPYSFVIDWLIPVGNYLQNKGAFANLEIVHLHRTDFIKETLVMTRQFTSGLDSNKSWIYMNDATVGYVVEKIKCSRSILTNLPKLPYPALKDPTSLTHILDSIALLRQLRK